MKTLGKIIAFVVGGYDLVITILVAYHFWGLTGVIGAILVPVSMLIAPIVLFLDSANPVPLVIILVGSTISWLMIRDWDASSGKQTETGIKTLEDGTLVLQIKQPAYGQPKYVSMQAKTLADVENKLRSAMQYSSVDKYEKEFWDFSEKDINSLTLERLYEYAAARMHLVVEVCAGDIMMFGDGPGSSPASTVIGEFNKWHNRLFRVEQGLTAIPEEVTQVAATVSHQYHSELAQILRDLCNLKDAGAISEQEFQTKKTEILSRM
ncbi:MAG: SHOCT domain-containing protein [Caldilineaceae bacterium]|nr:SHOCT domain-containing protein [Caldilineaceae bacterium]MBP8106631.1 SHOCT domain-containing protein [Caldilineaceae bacterium]MBP8124250.1 SHOCT domain-containing protein [Caldilineaceae bacterium]MBP9070904.1 SHOCT domain-containing protein [Caldilineaceae bacterium]